MKCKYCLQSIKKAADETVYILREPLDKELWYCASCDGRWPKIEAENKGVMSYASHKDGVELWNHIADKCNTQLEVNKIWRKLQALDDTFTMSLRDLLNSVVMNKAMQLSEKDFSPYSHWGEAAKWALEQLYESNTK